MGTNKRYPSRPQTWHPILAAEEQTPGHWLMLDPDGRTYGAVTLVKRGDQVGYRADSPKRELLGYFTTLRTACMAVHKAFLRSHGAGEFQGYPLAKY